MFKTNDKRELQYLIQAEDATENHLHKAAYHQLSVELDSNKLAPVDSQTDDQDAKNSSSSQSQSEFSSDNNATQNQNPQNEVNITTQQENAQQPNAAGTSETKEPENAPLSEGGNTQSTSEPTVPLSYLLIDGHTENLIYDPYGDPFFVLSVPRDLDIPFPPLQIEKVTLLVELPTLPEESGPCCTFVNDGSTVTIGLTFPPFLIDTQEDNEHVYFGMPPDGDEDDLVKTDFGSTLLGDHLQYQHTLDASTETAGIFLKAVFDAFNFVFEGFCSTQYNQVVFTPIAANVLALENLENPADSDHISLAPIAIPIIPDSDNCVIAPVSCNNPINEIDITLTYPGAPYNTLTPLTVQDWAKLFDFDSITDFIDGPDRTIRYCDNFRDVYKLVFVNGMPELVSNCEVDEGPIVLDLHNKGFELTDPSTSNISLNMNGIIEKTGWIGPDNGFLTYNYSGQGPIANNNFLLSQNVPKAQSDFQALVILAGQNSGVLDASNPIWNKLGVWQDSNQNGKMDNGEYHTLSQLGIVSINLTETGPTQMINGNTIHGVLSFNYANGSTGKAADVTLLNYQDIVQVKNSIVGLHESPAPQTMTSNTTNTTPVAPVHTDVTVQSALENQHQTTTHT